MTLEEFSREDRALRHAIQTGIAAEQTISSDAGFYRNNPTLGQILKHLRVGLNCAMVEHATILRLLIAKGLATEEEYFQVALEELRKEVRRLERALSEHTPGRTITLG